MHACLVFSEAVKRNIVESSMEEDPYMVGFILELFMGLFLSRKPRPKPVDLYDLCGTLIIKNPYEVKFIKLPPHEQAEIDLLEAMVVE